MDTKKIAQLANSITNYEDEKAKLNSLCSYKTEEEGGTKDRPLFIEIGGGSTHVKYYPKKRERIELIRTVITEMLNGDIDICEMELMKCLTNQQEKS